MSRVVKQHRNHVFVAEGSKVTRTTFMRREIFPLSDKYFFFSSKSTRWENLACENFKHERAKTCNGCKKRKVDTVEKFTTVHYVFSLLIDCFKGAFFAQKKFTISFN
jgi:hypothetical protein